MSLEIHQNPEGLQPSQAARPRLGVELMRMRATMISAYGEKVARAWEVDLPKDEWEALMEAKRTGLKA
jgi:hypothetical protein